jgi:hypothetical protein
MKYLNENIKQNCPVCNCPDGLLLYTINSEEATRNFRLKKTSRIKYLQLENHIKKLWGQSHCQVVKCCNCGFCYANPYVCGDKIFYDLAYERTGYPQWGFEFQKSFDAIKIIVKEKLENSNVLEIGAGDGAFLKEISPKFFKKTNVYCTEYSEYGINKLREIGFNVFDIDFRSPDISPFLKSMKFIFLHEVLEHLDNLDSTFNCLNTISTDNAHLFIGVPNDKRIEFNEINGAVLDMPPNHIGRWNLKSFEYVASKFGWQIIDYSIEEPNYEEIQSQFSYYRYLRKIQKKGSFDNFIETYNNKIINNRFFSIKRLLISFYKIQAESKIKNNIGSIGSCQWVHLDKTANKAK